MKNKKLILTSSGLSNITKCLFLLHIKVYSRSMTFSGCIVQSLFLGISCQILLLSLTKGKHWIYIKYIMHFNFSEGFLSFFPSSMNNYFISLSIGRVILSEDVGNIVEIDLNINVNGEPVNVLKISPGISRSYN